MVLFDGARWDVLFWSGEPADALVDEAPGYPDGLTIADYVDVLDTFIRRFG